MAEQNRAYTQREPIGAHKVVVQRLQGMSDVQVEGTEVMALGGLVVVDIVVRVKGGEGRWRRVAVEVDGPHHFMRNAPYQDECGGSTRLRNRLLEDAFDDVVVVGRDFSLKRPAESQEEWLRSKLGVAGVGRG